jgi:hypothetical protein
MKYTITRETSRIVDELTRLAECLQEHLPSISSEARREWEELRLRWPSELDIRQGTVGLTNDELAIMESKVRRFHDILAARAASPPGSRPGYARQARERSGARAPLHGTPNANASDGGDIEAISRQASEI